MSREDEDRGTRRGEVVVRRLRRDETDAFFQHLLRLDPEGRRRRFGGVVGACFLQDYAGRLSRPGSVVEGAFVGGVLRAVGELWPLDADGTAAEVAFSVEPGFRGRGLGSRLLERLVLVGGNQGVRLLTMVATPDNVPMQRLFRRHGGTVVVADGMAQGTIRTRWPTPFSVAKEALAEGEGAMDRLLGGFARPRAAAGAGPGGRDER